MSLRFTNVYNDGANALGSYLAYAQAACVGDEAATEALLQWLPEGASATDVHVTLLTLRAGAGHRSPSLAAALVRALDHPAPELRRAALRGLTVLTSP